jgi:hypothetical protein
MAESRERTMARQTRRLAWLSALKVSAGCCLCGYSSCGAALDFHHLDPTTKRFQLGGSYVGLKRVKFYSEMRKCILVCRNCHSEIHHAGRSVVGIPPFNPDDYPPMPA